MRAFGVHFWTLFFVALVINCSFVVVVPDRHDLYVNMNKLHVLHHQKEVTIEFNDSL